jgi:hypothetical protein
MPDPFRTPDLFLFLIDVHEVFIEKVKILTIEKRVCDLFEDVPRPRAFSSCGRVQGFPLSFRRDRQVRNATLPTLKNGENVDRAFRFSVRRETTRSEAKFFQFGRAVRPCAARTRLFRLNNTQNLALHAPLPVYCNFAALFTLYNCLSIKR